MTSTSLVKTQLHNSIADSVYKEVSSRTGRYYYFLGKAVQWTDENNPPVPIDSFTYEKETRKNIILVKEILPSDVAFVVDRRDWISGTVYDIYDDHYSTELVGLNLIAGGTNYSGNVTLAISGGSGSGATANALVVDGAIASVNLLTKGSGFVNKPNVIISDAYGSGGNVQAVLGYSYSGASSLQAANFYVVTDQFNIYKCLDNNNNSRSTVKPTETTPDAFTTSDGYKWKFMGNVPIFLRNKFLSPTFIPVTTSINSNFYSKGEIRSVNISDSGSGYTFARIVVQGDGYLEEEPYLVKNIAINYTGVGYANATVVIDPPITATSSWTANTFYSVGKILSYEKNYYEVVLAGYTPSYPPIHTVGIKQNGNVGLKFRGTIATANATLSNGTISSVVLDGASIRDIVITKSGSGYIDPPTVTISGGGGVNAAGYVNLVDNTIRRIVLTDTGSNYSLVPNVIIGSGWEANTFYDINEQVFYLTNLYTVTSNGYSNTTAPTHTLGSRTLGNAIFTYAGAKATANARLKYGAGYTGTPRAIIIGDNGGNPAGNANIAVEVEKTEAVLIPYIDDGGRITRVNIENGGIGYTYGTLTVVGDGSNASLQLNLSPGDLESLQALSELQTTPGAIHTIQVVSQGYNYANANVSISGDGTGATANATIVSGRITKINMINEGSGYTNATVTITGSGKGASARAILPPYNGHGKDTINELYARNLGFYSTINQEENQGFIVTNDYRQFGIIKDIRNFNNSKFFNNGTGSTCYLISGTINTNIFTEDVLVRRASDNTAFLIISSSNSAILVSSLDDTTPVIGDTISASTGNSFVVTGVINPDVDKYSGELVYIDNRRAFSTTEDQSVSLNTVIRF